MSVHAGHGPSSDMHTRFVGAFLPPESDDPQRRVLVEIVALGLEKNAWELDTLGYTILTPEQVDGALITSALREELLAITERSTGVRPDVTRDDAVDTGLTAIGRGQFLHHVLFKDPIFEDALLNRSMLALISYLLGESAVLSSMNAMLKGRGPERLELHSDQVGQPAPLPPYAQVANATWLLTDFSAEAGATCFVPGSHKLCRHPTRAEAVDTSTAATVSAPAGSILIWHGNTWHGAAARTRSGLRASLIMLFCRWYILPQALYRQTATSEMLGRNPTRFATLMGRRTPYSGYHSDDPAIALSTGSEQQYA